jgi:tripartite-type tricarboxylate transporter receptor subunit TctC
MRNMFAGRFTRRFLSGLSITFCAGAMMLVGSAGAPAMAKYPEQPVTIIVPWPAGGATDLATRRFSESLAKEMGVSVVVENRPGATGVVGSGAAANASPNGYTLLLASAETHAINPYTYDKLPYDPEKDFIPIAAFAINPYSLVARSDFPAATTAELVEEIRRNPEKYSYSSASLGTASQIVMEMLKAAENLEILHVPYQGEAPAVTALMGGQVDLMILPAGRAMALRESGKLKVYAATLSERFPGMPDVPTFKEEGFEKIQIANWFALMAPRNTPDEAVRKIEQAVRAIVDQPQTVESMGKLGLEVFKPMPQPEFADFVGNERKRWGQTIENAGIRVGK